MSEAPDLQDPETDARGGRCAIVGRPNVGKSTLLNRLLGQKLVIATARPGTTRSAVLGVYVDDEPPTQIAFVDTPGLARPRTALHKVLVEEAATGLADAEVVLFVTEPHDGIHPGDEEALRQLGEISAPIILAINKVDTLAEKERLLPQIAKYQEHRELAAVVPISARKGTNLAGLVSEIRERLPQGLLYQQDMLTDRPERFFVAELIRESVIRRTRQEVPYGAAVVIDKFSIEGRLTRIQATVIVEKPSHKGIVIGKGGSMIKTIGTEARESIQRFLESKVHLELFVKVIEGWTSNPDLARRLATQVDP